MLDTQVGFWCAQKTVDMIFTTSQEKHGKITEEPRTVIINTDKSWILLPMIVSRSFSYEKQLSNMICSSHETAVNILAENNFTERASGTMTGHVLEQFLA